LKYLTDIDIKRLYCRQGAFISFFEESGAQKIKPSLLRLQQSLDKKYENFCRRPSALHAKRPGRKIIVEENYQQVIGVKRVNSEIHEKNLRRSFFVKRAGKALQGQMVRRIARWLFFRTEEL